MADGTASIADVLALSKGNDGIFGGNGVGFVVLILFIMMWGGGFGAFGANARAAEGATTAELYSSLGSQDLKNDVRSGFQDVASSLCQNRFDVISSMTNGFNSVNSNINQLQSNMQMCCCDLKTTMHAEGEATRALIQQNTIQALRDKLSDRDRDLQAANLTLANSDQTSKILASLGNYYQNPPVHPAWGSCNSCACSGTY